MSKNMTSKSGTRYETFTPEDWIAAAKRVRDTAEKTAAVFDREYPDGSHAADKEAYMTDMQLAFAAMMHIAKFCAGDVKFIILDEGVQQ